MTEAPIADFHGTPLTNFWVEKDGKTNEHRFQAAKSLDPAEQAWVMEAKSPGEAKRRGRRITLRPGWDDIRIGVMYDLCRAKFEDPELREALLATGDRELIEGNTWRDTFWGVCKGKGHNHLGQILMRIRSEIRDGQ